MATPLSPEAVLPTSPAPLPSASEAASDVPAVLPDAVLEIPVVYGLLHGSPAAIYADMTTTDPELELLGQNADVLSQSGIGFYGSKDQRLGVLYNTAYVDEAQLVDADAAGKLTDVAAPYEQVKQQFGAAVSGGAAPSAPAPVAAAPAGNPPSTAAQKKITTARLKNLQVGDPTSGPRPGAGRIINMILRPVV